MTYTVSDGNVSFGALRAANTARIPQFKNKQGEIAHDTVDGSDWSPADWLTAVCGELGELANKMKKLRRGDIPNEQQQDFIDYEIAPEMADVVIYLDILAKQFGVSLGIAVQEKFNKVSSEQGIPVMLDYDTWYEIVPAS